MPVPDISHCVRDDSSVGIRPPHSQLSSRHNTPNCHPDRALAISTLRKSSILQISHQHTAWTMGNAEGQFGGS